MQENALESLGGLSPENHRGGATDLVRAALSSCDLSSSAMPQTFTEGHVLDSSAQNSLMEQSVDNEIMRQHHSILPSAASLRAPRARAVRRCRGCLRKGRVRHLHDEQCFLNSSGRWNCTEGCVASCVAVLCPHSGGKGACVECDLTRLSVDKQRLVGRSRASSL